jgi:hypothetical protein
MAETTSRPQRIDGKLYDIPAAERGFQRYTSELRADIAASFRLTQGQRASIGEAFWTHPLCPGVCYPTRIAALRAALESLTPRPPEDGA